MKQQEVQERDFYSVAEVAKRIGCSRQLIWRQADEGKIPYSMFGKKMFIPAKYLDDRIDEAMPPKLGVYICKNCGTYNPNWEQEQTK